MQIDTPQVGKAMRPFADHQPTVRLDPSVEANLRESGLRIIIVGAGGWIGKSLLAGLAQALGREGLESRVACFGSTEREIAFGMGPAMAQRPLHDLATLDATPSVLFHLAFLTKDKIAGMDEDEYVARNRAISAAVLDALDKIGVDRIFLASSGAAAFADDPDAAHDLRLYGRLKRDDEASFAQWAAADPARRAMIMRIYSMAGPFINKHDTYALASFILAALSDRPIRVEARVEVVRSYVAVREMLSLALAHLLGESGPELASLDSGGDPMELGDVASLVAQVLGGTARRAPIETPGGSIYAGNPSEYARLMDVFAVQPVTLDEAIMDTAAYLALGDAR